ncbi:MAG: hypothetical protein IIB95_10590 [Candidatus Marinimicrobia bacterium]|nr:hypothetical protein [Candidatus Neomarinimicrobiota bacterium]MCH7764170.1 hypothetical protein [Candidatus Neomarinimicrobiota bacterium]
MVRPYYSDDDSSMITKKRLVSEPLLPKPHVVILGAGASKQAFPRGDANGRKLPVMDDFVDIVGLQSILDKSAIKFENRNFEELYSELYEKNPKSQILKDVEKKIIMYFDSLKITDEPTLYDHLLLSLRSKDVVATFNWDPLLFDAWVRNLNKAQLPVLLHLHGNVRIGYCKNHNFMGDNGRYCPECYETFTPSQLLYPITKKNYKDDYFIKGEWEVLENALNNAFAITIFGYGAPKTDINAVELMEKAWKAKGKRELETSEFIDVKEEELILQQWKHFIHSQHYLHFNDFYQSWIPNHPRRSCEALYVPTILGKFVEEFPIPRELGFDELFTWLSPLIEAEEKLINPKPQNAT